MKTALAFLLALAAPLAAWGPFSHQIVDAAALRAVAGRPGLEFLARADCTAAFVAAAAVPDLTFSFTQGGKTDEKLDDLLHQPEFHKHLVAEARRSGHAPELAFALGFAGHVVADEAGNGPDSVSRRDLFGLAGDLGYLQTGMIKLLVDGVLAARPERAQVSAPRVNTGLLSRALASYRGPLAQSGSQADWARRVTDLERSYAESYDLWMQVAFLVSRNDRLRRDLTGLPLGPDATWGVSGIQPSVDAVVALLDATRSPTATAASPGVSSTGIIPLLGVSNIPAGSGPATTVSRVERALDLAGALIPGVGLMPRPLGPIQWLKEKAVEATATVSLWALEHAPARLLDQRKRTFAAFCLALARQEGGLAELRKHVRREAGR